MDLTFQIFHRRNSSSDFTAKMTTMHPLLRADEEERFASDYYNVNWLWCIVCELWPLVPLPPPPRSSRGPCLSVLMPTSCRERWPMPQSWLHWRWEHYNVNPPMPLIFAALCLDLNISARRCSLSPASSHRSEPSCRSQSQRTREEEAEGM